MPRGKQPAKSPSVNGGKSKSIVHVDNDSEDDDHSGIDAESTTADPTADFSDIKDQLLQQMEIAVHQSNAKYKGFDFSKIQIEGRTKEELAACYAMLRNSAFSRVRQLPLREEIQMVKEHGRLKTANSGPKRPTTSFFRYKDDALEKLFKRQPEMKKNYMQAVKLVGEQWKNLSPEKKRPYEEASKKEREKFRQEHPEFFKAPAKRSQTETRSPSRKKPAKPKTAFELFCEAKRKEYSEKYELKGAELDQKLATKFGKLSDRKRQKWDDRAREAMDEYISTLSQRSQATTAADAAFEDPIAQPPVSKKAKKAKKGAAEDDREDYMDTILGGNAASLYQTPKSSQASKSKAAPEKNDWLH